VEIRDNEVYKICNFEKRKYVKSFPTMGYWFSLIPVWPMLTSLVSNFCCAVIPNIFDGFRDRVIKQPEPATGNIAVGGTRYVQAAQVRQYNQAYGRTDTKAVLRQQTRGLQVTTRLGGDSAINFLNRSQVNQPGVGKQVLLQSRTQDAVAELERNEITVGRVEQYDERKASQYLAEYSRTPQWIDRGSEVTVVEKNGKVMYYAATQPTTAATPVEISGDLRAEIAELEARKSALQDFSAVDAELARVETRRESLADVKALGEEITELQTARSDVEADLAALRSQVDTVRASREAEEVRLAELSARRDVISAEINALSDNMDELDVMRRDLTTEVTRTRPVADIAEVDSDTDGNLRELGIRTMGELSEADPVEFERVGIEPERARVLIDAARSRVGPQR
jgi:hypothetical protein